MGIWSLFAISRSGMDSEQLRAEFASQNIANANAVVAPGARKVNPFRVISMPATGPFSAVYNNQNSLLQGTTTRVVEIDAPLRKVSDPAHPLADVQGYVNYPGINTLDEMLALTMAVRAYEANATAFNSTKIMMSKALEIGGRNG